jgi:hypothetical protein
MKVGKLPLSSFMMATLLMSAICARADQITLGGTSQPITFTGDGSSQPTMLSLTLGTCNAITLACNLTGTPAFGDGSLSSGPAAYGLNSTKGTLALTLTNASAGQWSVQQTAPILFSYGPSGSLLKGDLTLWGFEETPGSKSGVFNYAEDLNLVVTGGSLASAFGTHGTADLLITFTSKQNIETLLGTTESLKASVSSGELVPTPEPGSASTVLLALVMMTVGGVILRRGQTSSQPVS